MSRLPYQHRRNSSTEKVTFAPARYDHEHRCNACDFSGHDDWIIMIHQGSPFNPSCYNAGISAWREKSHTWILIHEPQLSPLPIVIKSTLAPANTQMDPTAMQVAKSLFRNAVQRASDKAAEMLKHGNPEAPELRQPLDEWEVLEGQELEFTEEMEVDIRVPQSLIERVLSASGARQRSASVKEYLQDNLPRMADHIDQAAEAVFHGVTEGLPAAASVIIKNPVPAAGNMVAKGWKRLSDRFRGGNGDSR
ncbi:hypothetical protein EDC01DRAFT_232067 [Geopyxis carbonaria]|nr:hypothetical protein EDC01DRAFT_232067 [Geopyxis carbonaria]